MNEIKKEDVQQEVFDLYDDYAHNRLDRRDWCYGHRWNRGGDRIDWAQRRHWLYWR